MDSHDVTNAVGHAACTLAKDIRAGAIMAITKTGYTARRMSKFRPYIMLIGATPYEKTYHQLSLVWGVCPIIAHYRYEIEELFAHCARKAIRAGLIQEGDRIGRYVKKSNRHGAGARSLLTRRTALDTIKARI